MLFENPVERTVHNVSDLELVTGNRSIYLFRTEIARQNVAPLLLILRVVSQCEEAAAFFKRPGKELRLFANRFPETFAVLTAVVERVDLREAHVHGDADELAVLFLDRLREQLQLGLRKRVKRPAR